MRLLVVVFALLLMIGLASAASPSGAPDTPLTPYRVEAAEVHVAFSGFDKRNRPATKLSPSDFMLLRDGRHVEETVTLERRHESPILAMVMTDVSDSMMKAVPIARDSWQWMNANILRAADQVAYFDFGAELSSGNSQKQFGMHLTSFYDCLLKLIPQVSRKGSGRGNDSIHSLQDVTNLAVERDIAVYAITTWRFKINYDDQVLDQLTSTTGRRYFVVNHTKQMTSALQEITQEPRNGYEVIFSRG